MKLFLTVTYGLCASFIFGQKNQIEQPLQHACQCLDNVAENHKDKYEFDQGFGSCLDSLFKSLQSIDTIYYDVKELSKTIKGPLTESCASFEKVDSMHNYYSKENNFIVKTQDCQILRNGKYVGLNDKDSSIINMMDSLQIINFKSGTFTKSKVVWLGPCSYKLVRIESTDSYESQTVKPGEERVFRIIGVENGAVFTYEVEFHGKIYTGKLIKLE